MNKVSIIILSYHTLAYTRLCIESIRAYTEPDTYEIIVVDNGSQDGSLEYLRAQPDVRLIENGENRGFPAACNQGMQAAAEGNDLLLLNSDTIVTPRWLANLRRVLAARPEAGAVGCVTNAASHFQQIPVDYDDIDAMLRFAEGFNVSRPEAWQPWLALAGFCLLIRREAYETIGGLDEAFSPGNYEDDDYCLRLREAGYTCLLAQDTFIHHFGSVSFRKGETSAEAASKEARFAAILQHNKRRLLEKHHLPQDWNTLHALVRHVPEDALCPGRRLLIVDARTGTDVYVMRAAHPGLIVDGLTFDQESAARTQGDIGLLYAPPEAAAIDRALGAYRYHFVVLLGDSAQLRGAEAILGALRDHLTMSGVLYFADAERVYQQRKLANHGFPRLCADHGTGV